MRRSQQAGLGAGTQQGLVRQDRIFDRLVDVRGVELYLPLSEVKCQCPLHYATDKGVINAAQQKFEWKIRHGGQTRVC